jgi:tetrahydromethanopterin S-methyltransferase subunit G
MKNQKILVGLILLLVMINLTSCAPSGYESHEAGFFSGIWHGIIIVFSLIGKLFGADIGIYAEHNTGFFYWLGFIIGIGALGGGGGAARR